MSVAAGVTSQREDSGRGNSPRSPHSTARCSAADGQGPAPPGALCSVVCSSRAARKAGAAPCGRVGRPCTELDSRPGSRQRRLVARAKPREAGRPGGGRLKRGSPRADASGRVTLRWDAPQRLSCPVVPGEHRAASDTGTSGGCGRGPGRLPGPPQRGARGSSSRPRERAALVRFQKEDVPGPAVLCDPCGTWSSA